MKYSELEIKFAETIAITLKEIKKLNSVIEVDIKQGLINTNEVEKAKRDTLLNTLSLLDYKLFRECFPIMKDNVLLSEDMKKIIMYGKEKDLLQYDRLEFYGLYHK